jgi:hypothetical protein
MDLGVGHSNKKENVSQVGKTKLNNKRGKTN